MKAPRDGWDPEEIDALQGIGEAIESLRKRHENDPPSALLRAAHHEALPSELQDDARHYLSTHPWSRALAEGFDAAAPPLPEADQNRLLARIQEHIRTDAATSRSESRSAWWVRPVLTMSAFAAVVLAVGIWRSAVTAPPPAAVTPPAQARGASSPAPSVSTGRSAPSAPQVQEGKLPLEKPQVMLTPAALTWRGPGLGSQLLPDLKPAVDAYRRNDYARADREFGALETRYPNAVEVFFFGGVSRLFLGDPERAIVAFTKAEAIGDAMFAPHVAWYRAVAEERAGHAAEARAQLGTLCRSGGERASRACEVLKEMGGR
jgi:hypothetical protein